MARPGAIWGEDDILSFSREVLAPAVVLEPFKVFEALRAHMSILIVAQARDPSRVRIAAIFLETHWPVNH